MFSFHETALIPRGTTTAAAAAAAAAAVAAIATPLKEEAVNASALRATSWMAPTTTMVDASPARSVHCADREREAKSPHGDSDDDDNGDNDNDDDDAKALNFNHSQAYFSLAASHHVG
ncbi:unnamed protein product [Soboliphyme baturini]|uniref:Secreted protein n=1 Tax=Soboliphyme baturini TaxID=241478 RepID=A0A183IL77_9BILA|nr:unnamed protein product [Soboliphyme baturini]